jgi:hypothetical protein
MILSLSLVGCVNVAATQPSPQDDEILIAAARYIQSQYSTNRVAIHPRVFKVFPAPRSGTYGDVRAASRTEAIAQRLGATVQTKRGEQDIMIGLSDPVRDESGVSVHATISYSLRRYNRTGAGAKDVILTLTRSESGWQVTGERLLRIT